VLAATERLFDRAFGAQANPLRNLGGLGFVFFWVLAVSGIYLYIRFDTSVAGAWDSIDHLTREEWWLGGLLRSVHRYAADGFVAVTALHLVKEIADGHFRHYRAFSWVSGVPLIWLLLGSGVIGYWLVWDARAHFSATATAEWFDALGVLTEPMVRNFLARDSTDDRLFSLFVFLHLGLPLALLAGMWVHVKRLGFPKNLPPAALSWGTVAMLFALALAAPVHSHAPANPALLPRTLEIDWFLLFAHPLMYATSPGFLWLLASGATVVLTLLPWLTRRPAPQAAVVDLANCNGCGRCVADCPFAAVILVPAANRNGRQVQVFPELCAGCGICAGACPSSTPFRTAATIASGIDLPQLTVNDLRARLESELARLEGAAKVVVFSCDEAAQGAGLADARTAVLGLPCVGMVPPSFMEYALRNGADGVLLAGCRDGECAYRLGIEWTRARLAGEREPRLRASVPHERLRLIGAARGDEAALTAALAEFRNALAGAAAPRALPPKRKLARA
jgi:quinol-cytochrome oxidoreductase complex cytochrome b subunit/coenzyme F420-reducing hydrogenase delta subunit